MTFPIPPGYTDPHNAAAAQLPGTDPWLPSDLGFVATSGDIDAGVGTNSVIIAGSVYLVKVNLRGPAAPVGHINWAVQTAGTGASTQSFTGLYDPTGKLIVGSADISASLTIGLGNCALSSQVPASALPWGSFVWAALVTNFATTQPTMFRAGGGSAALTAQNGALAASVLRFAINGTGATALPNPITVTSNTQTNAIALWAGLAP